MTGFFLKLLYAFLVGGFLCAVADRDSVIAAAGGGTPKLFRAPSGSYNNTLIKTAAEEGFTTIQWDVDSLDWKDYGTDSIIKTVTGHKHLGNGSIILCHNGAKYTAQALDMLLTTLKERGYTFVPISELIYKDHFYMDVEGRQIPMKN